MSTTERRLAAIVFTDIVGYSAMMQKDETITTKIREKHREAFNRLSEKYGGNIIQYFGDGTLSIYPSATAAVEFAEHLQQELRSGYPPVPMRVGIHTGDITFGNDDAYGDGVNIASRIESMCVPGGVFISGKVYDDIKNHARIRTKHLGPFRLKNITNSVEIYALTNKGLTAPEVVKKALPPKRKKARKKNKQIKGGKSKTAAFILGIAFGIFGTHRFYLGNKIIGAMFLISFFLGAFILPFDLSFLIPIGAIVGFVDAMILLFMSKDEFDRIYNKDLLDEKEEEEEEEEYDDYEADDGIMDQTDFLKNQFDLYFDRGLSHFKRYENKEAIADLTRAAEIRYDDPEIHFMLARCYSMVENKDKGFAHLDAAVAFGVNVERIEKNDDLAFLRFQKGYEAFSRNEYRLPKSNIEEFLEEESETNPDIIAAPDLLEQLAQLKKLRDKGFLTEEEYLLQERKMKA